MSKICFIIAGPNGAGKTTFAKELLPNEGQCINFVNADLIADGLAPFNPRSAAVQAGKIMLKQIEKHVAKGENFAFETTLSGVTYIKKIEYWQSTGYKVVLYYFSLPDPQMAISRVKHRVSQGGHNFPEEDIVRRYYRSQQNLEQRYKQIVDEWAVFESTSNGLQPKASSLEKMSQ